MAGRDRKGRSSKRKGPGGPSRSAGRVTEPSPRPSPEGPSDRLTAKAAPGLPPLDALVDLVLEQFAEVLPDDAPDPQHVAEIWADEFLGPSSADDDVDLDATRAALAEGLALKGDRLADLALAGLARSTGDDGSVRRPFREAWAVRAAAPDVDDQARTLGDDRPIEAIAITHPTGDGTTLVLAIDNPAGPFTVGAYVDHNLGGALTDALVGPPLGEIRAMYDPAENTDGFVLAPVDLAELGARCRAAIARTVARPDLPVSEDLFALLPFVSRRLDLLPRPVGAPAPEPALDDDARTALVAEVLAAPEAAELDADVRPWAPEAARHWVDHALDRTQGGPLRVSAGLVEAFCTDGFPHTVDDPASGLVEALPPVVAAWLRYAARTTGVDDRWLDDALAALDATAPQLVHDHDHPHDHDHDHDHG